MPFSIIVKEVLIYFCNNDKAKLWLDVDLIIRAYSMQN